jgi:hypothetical protein
MLQISSNPACQGNGVRRGDECKGPDRRRFIRRQDASFEHASQIGDYELSHQG